MRFSILNLFSLTAAAAILAALVRIGGGHLLVVLMIAGFLFAPLLMALVSSFFQGVQARIRKRVAYSLLVIMAILPATIGVATTLIHPLVGIVFLAFISGLWFMQIDIFEQLHQ